MSSEKGNIKIGLGIIEIYRFGEFGNCNGDNDFEIRGGKNGKKRITKNGRQKICSKGKGKI